MGQAKSCFSRGSCAFTASIILLSFLYLKFLQRGGDYQLLSPSLGLNFLEEAGNSFRAYSPAIPTSSACCSFNRFTHANFPSFAFSRFRPFRHASPPSSSSTCSRFNRFKHTRCKCRHSVVFAQSEADISGGAGTGDPVIEKLLKGADLASLRGLAKNLHVSSTKSPSWQREDARKNYLDEESTIDRSSVSREEKRDPSLLRLTLEEDAEWLPSLKHNVVWNKSKIPLGSPITHPYIIEGSKFDGKDPFGELLPETPIPRGFSTPIESAVDEFRKKGKKLLVDDEAPNEGNDSASLISESAFINYEEANLSDLEDIPEEEDEKFFSGNLASKANENISKGKTFYEKQWMGRDPLEVDTCVSESSDLPSPFDGQKKRWDVMDGHTLEGTPFRDGEILWDTYDPGGVYLHEKGDYREEVAENPFYNGKIKAEMPSYLNPSNPFQRTGRLRDWHRRTDSGKKQLQRWSSGPFWKQKNDIPRGNWKYKDDTFTDMLLSVDWERVYPHHHDQNYYKRSCVETGWGQVDRVEDSYWDIQFIGSPDTFPRTDPVGMSFNWMINWAPWLVKKFPRKVGQPIKSKPFNMGGVEPLQVWFYPAGTALSEEGFCSIKLVSRPGWNLPFPMYLWASSEYGKIITKPMLHESKEYLLHSLNFCRLLDKQYGGYPNAANSSFDPHVDLILGPSGNVEIGVGIADDKWEWDDGAWEYEQWIKEQSASPDDEWFEELCPTYSHSELYENFKYKDIPDKHFINYMPQRLPGAKRHPWDRNSF